MASIPALKQYFESLIDISKRYDENEEVYYEFLLFCLYVISGDGKASAKEMKLLSELTGSKINKEAIKDILNVDWQEFSEKVPKTLVILRFIDTEEGNDWDNSRVHRHLCALKALGETLAEADGKNIGQQRIVGNYLNFLLESASLMINGPTNTSKTSIEKSVSSSKSTKEKDKRSDPVKTDKSQPNQQKKQDKNTNNTVSKGPSSSVKADTPKQLKIPVPSSEPKAKSTSYKVPLSGGTTKLDFWQTLKPYMGNLKHKEFDNVKIKDSDSLEAKPIIIVGVYNCIMIRVTQKLLRLELYIDTDTEVGNLQIIDHIKKKMKVTKELKDRIEFNRKEGRNAQRVFLNIEGFELQDRSSWAKYIEAIISTADAFFDAVEAPMKELV